MPNALAARRAGAFKNLPVHHRAQSLDDAEAPPPADGEQQGAGKLFATILRNAEFVLKRQSSNSRRRILKKQRRKLQKPWKERARSVPYFFVSGYRSSQ